MEFQDPQFQKLLNHVAPQDIPPSEDLSSATGLEEFLRCLGEPPLSLVAVGDIMLGGRAKKTLSQSGSDSPFEAVMPILRRASIVLGNLEGPLAQCSLRTDRRFSYKVGPDNAASLTRAGINVLTFANNHALDCGPAGVIETMEALARARAACIGAGVNERAAHSPAILMAGEWRVGLLGYYWNRRYAATADLPGVANGTRTALEADIRSLRERVDRVVVTFHWGVPYDRVPSESARRKARLAVDLGADVVVGHHPHIIQPFEIHRGRPIFYSVGNFTFGSRNSRAEGLLVGIRFEETQTVVNTYPLYVKNRDPRVNYQPKILRGESAERVLRHLADISGPTGGDLRIEMGRGILRLHRLPVNS
jgi:hypothetical protein